MRSNDEENSLKPAGRHFDQDGPLTTHRSFIKFFAAQKHLGFVVHELHNVASGAPLRCAGF